MAETIEELERRLNDLNPAVRTAALEQLVGLLETGEVVPPEPTGAVNVHLHTFFSFNAESWSPSRVVWEGKKRGLDVVGSVDFDVLDAMEELFRAGDALAVRTVAALETRVYMADYADKDINSPGEPGVSYFMGTGFASLPAPGSEAAETLDAMRDQARRRNVAMLNRVNLHLAPVDIDYESEVLPLTPSGNATERHMLAVYDGRARGLRPERADLAAFWAEKLDVTAEAVDPLLDDPAALRNTIRKKLMKRGGVGYVQPDATTFPPLEKVVRMVLACEAVPCATWLDGTSAGEVDPERLLDDYMHAGCLALNIIPDRNWNIDDEETRRRKVAHLDAVVAAARERDLILSVGTEMNNYGLKAVDNFDAPPMRPHAAAFRDGAYILYGHTVLQRARGMGRTGTWARDTFGDDRARANAFYLEVGRRAFPPAKARRQLGEIPDGADPEAVLALLPA